jgi:uncharacterized protein with HEPN domain
VSGEAPPAGRVALTARYGERTVLALDDFLEHAAMAERLLRHGREALDVDETVRLATEAVMHRLGESASRMNPEFVADHPELGLRDIKDARNFAAHHYRIIAHRTFWDAFEDDLPPIAAAVRGLLGDPSE